MTSINVLHISDLHFGMESPKDITLAAHRKNALAALKQTVSKLSSTDRPHLVIVSGDITWQGKASGFDEAALWLNSLLEELNLEKSQLIVCAGNHDIQRAVTLGTNPPTSSKDADVWLRVENWANFVRPFNEYNGFCEKFPIEPLHIDDCESYLAGVRSISGLNIVVLNSAWFCRDREDRGKLWLGLPQLQLMVSNGQLFPKGDFDTAPLTLAVVHHPKEWFSDEDQHTYDNRPAAYRYLAEHSHLIFSGHVHAAPEAPNRINGKAFVIQGGASYSGGNYRNNFSLVKIDNVNRSVTQIPFEYDPRFEQWNRMQEHSFFFQIGNPHTNAVWNTTIETQNISAAAHIHTAVQHWSELSTFEDSPELTPELFLINRSEACEKLKEIFYGKISQLQIDTLFPNQVADFVAAYVSSLDKESSVEFAERCLIVSNVEAWNEINLLKLEPYFLVANFDLDDSEMSIKLLDRSIKRGHRVIYSGMPGGLPQSNRVTIRDPKSYQIKESLEKAGYSEERARTLAHNCDGNLSSLLRSLRHLSLIPEWAQGTDATELLIAELLGSWSEKSEADKSIAEKLSGSSYGDWSHRIRDIAIRPSNPLITSESNWKIVLRYEAWYALGPRISDELLNRLKEVAVLVLTEADPRFELAPEERFAASIYGKTMIHSRLLRRGLAETLAMLGSHSKALVYCSFGKAEVTASLIVKEVMDKADWVLWASLDYLLPLLAEAAPNEFLNAVEHAVSSRDCPFKKIFSQEGKGLTGGNYMSGLLWALETLAWDARYLTRVILVLGELAVIDPGGNWANRPSNSLSTILLPWLPQTSANILRRKTAVESLVGENPEVAWKLLLSLLPKAHQVSSGSHKPSWRKWIADDWTSRVSVDEYLTQTDIYASLTLNLARSDLSKLFELVQRLDDLPTSAREQLMEYLGSDEVVHLSEDNRLDVWNELEQLINKHQKYSDAKWAMDDIILRKLRTIADNIAPTTPINLHQRLFNNYESNLFDEVGNYEEQRKKIEYRRQSAISEIYSSSGLDSILEFAKLVEHSRIVGICTGMISEKGIEVTVLPQLLLTEEKGLSQFIAGYVLGMFRTNGWDWVDQFDMSDWSHTQIGQFLAFLPFNNETWKRSLKLLPDNQQLYWTKVSVAPYEADSNLDGAIDRLLEFNRSHSAVRCLDKLLHEYGKIDSQLGVRVLKALINAPESKQWLDSHSVVEIITALQNNEDTNVDEIAQIEWQFLPLLHSYPGASPRQLEHQLANNPDFFCQIINLVFRSTNDEKLDEISEEKQGIASNAYRLLQEWSRPPGMGENNDFDGDILIEWIKEVKRLSTESGHIEAALSMTGHVLIHAPSDPNGLWIHESAAKVLNDKDAKKMREGYRIELFNSRGVFSPSGGKEEQILAEMYYKKADDVEAYGYHRLADTLRQIASSYESDAQRAATDDPFEF